MRTGEEMYQYCVDSKFGEGTSKKWGIKHFSVIEKTLSPDEEVKMCFIGLHNYVSMSKTDGNFAYAITNKRIIMAQQKWMGQHIKSVEFDRLNDITLQTGMALGILTIDTMKEKFNVALNKRIATNINNKIQEILGSLRQQKNAPTIIQATSSADEILKYKNLLDMGIITQAEFDDKKVQLLES